MMKSKTKNKANLDSKISKNWFAYIINWVSKNPFLAIWTSLSYTFLCSSIISYAILGSRWVSWASFSMFMTFGTSSLAAIVFFIPVSVITVLTPWIISIGMLLFWHEGLSY